MGAEGRSRRVRRRRGAREGLSPLSARGVGIPRSSSSCCRAAQQEKTAELAGREPSAGGGGYGCLARLGAARAHGEAAWGAANVLLGSISTFTSEPLVARACALFVRLLYTVSVLSTCLTAGQ